MGRVTTTAVRLGAQENRAEGRADSEPGGARPKPGSAGRPVMGVQGEEGGRGAGGGQQDTLNPACGSQLERWLRDVGAGRERARWLPHV